MKITERYIDPFTDFGRFAARFKKLFGEEPSKELLIDFLNELLKQHTVKLVELATQEIFYDKLTFIYLEMAKFNKAEAELVTHFDK